MTNKTQILSTAFLDQQFVTKAVELGVQLDVMSFIKVSAIESEELAERVVDLCYLPITAVFTSVNAVKAVSDIIMSADPKWDIYCIGNATMEAVKGQFRAAEIIGVAGNAVELAKIIIEDGEEEVVFFCGNQRLDTLPDTLRENDVEVYEMMVYETTQIPTAVEKEYDGILFFSPTGVDSFFSVNKIGADTVLFAIGNTTANAIKRHTLNKVIFSQTASKDSVVDYAIKYFDK